LKIAASKRLRKRLKIKIICFICVRRASHAYQFNAAFSRVLGEMREAERTGNTQLAAQLDREQIQMQSDFWRQ
jgi:hypothetical protein